MRDTCCDISVLSVSTLPDVRFHRLITKGLLGIYCSDKEVHAQKDVRMVPRKLAPLGARAVCSSTSSVGRTGG